MKLMDEFTGKSFQNLENILLLDFVADISTEETKELKNGYLRDRKKILEFYSTGNFLENTLNKLSEN